MTGAYDNGTFGALERVGLHKPARPNLPRECFWRIVAGRAILATGALERPIAFPMNDRPGIMMASAVRSYLNRYGVAAGQRVTLYANNDPARAVARELMAAGVKVAAIIDPRLDASAVEDCPVHLGADIVDTRGRHGLKEITVRKGAEEFRIETDCLAMSGGWNPTLHLTCHERPPEVERGSAGLRPERRRGAGACGGGGREWHHVHPWRADQRQGRGRGRAEGAGPQAGEGRSAAAEDAPYRAGSVHVVSGKGRAWLDFANDVTVKDVKLAAQENYASSST